MVMQPTRRTPLRRGMHAALLRAAFLAALLGVAQRASATPCPPAGAPPRPRASMSSAFFAFRLTLARPLRSLGAHACRRGRARLRRRRGRGGAVLLTGGRCGGAGG